ncbi:uncharacterized protein LOC115227360 [Octopus sinensis]|uniref:Uncharacterized protein LOC115227360 n=1 Tax=Octopus sinensis TaxID=2607531 RepID=A0A6P7TPH0_9MOLL|nr:uncharacterized protein LOC115227360 [Octopus sinensis]
MSSFRPISTQQDYLYLTKLARVDYYFRHQIGLEPIGALRPDFAQESLDLISLCRLISSLGYSECVGDTLAFNLDNSSILTTPCGVSWSVLRAQELICVTESGLSDHRTNSRGYNTLLYKINKSIFHSFPELKFAAFLCSPMFIATSMDKSRRMQAGVSILEMNDLGGIGLEPTEILAKLSYSISVRNLIHFKALLIHGLGAIVISRTADELFISLKKLIDSFPFASPSNSNLNFPIFADFSDWNSYVQIQEISLVGLTLVVQYLIKLIYLVIMGITGLTKLIGDYAPSAIKHPQLNNLFGKN